MVSQKDHHIKGHTQDEAIQCLETLEENISVGWASKLGVENERRLIST